MMDSGLLSTRIFKYLFLLKTNPRTYKIENLNGEITIGSFYEKELLLSKLSRSYYPEPDSHNTDQVKIVLELKIYTTKNNYDMMQVLI